MEASQPAVILSSPNSSETSPMVGGTLPTAYPTTMLTKIAIATTPHRVRITRVPAAPSSAALPAPVSSAPVNWFVA